ncbi:MAG: winged helix-turn-helix domain-containing protein [Thermoplasmataceae archaeon]
MEESQQIERLMSAISNRTKLSIITLLVRRKRMTVTQMSKLIGTTRSNLYQSIGDLVKSGIINEPESVINRNYVEKYYTLNEPLFRELDSERWKVRLQSLSADQSREIVVSFLLSQSMNLQIMAQEIQMSSEKASPKIREFLRSDRIFMSYGRISDATYDRLLEHEKALMQIFQENPEDDGDNTYVILGIPGLTESQEPEKSGRNRAKSTG